jgi:hypothetical protein
MSTATLERTATELSVQVSLNTAKSIASLANFTSRDKITPALTVVKVMFAENFIAAIATDRYVGIKGVYGYEYDAYGTIYLDAAAVKFINGLKNSPYVQFDLSDGALTIGDGGTSVSGLMFSGNYPAIESIIDKHRAAELATPQRFTIELIAKLGKVIDPVTGRKIEVWELEQGHTDNPNRPAPLKAVPAGFDGLEAIIQPNLVR